MGCDGIRTSALFGAVAAAFLGGFMAGPPKAVAQEGQLSDLYNECSPAYAGFRRQVYESLLQQARLHQGRAAAAQAGQRFDEMLAEYARAMDYLRRVGMLPPASLPDPCPPASEPPPFKIPGTEIAVYDIDLAGKWGRRLEALQQNTCSNRHPPLLRQAKEDANSDRAARERAAGESQDREARARLASDAKALEQLEAVLPEEPCSGRPLAPAGAGGLGQETATSVFEEDRWRLNEEWSFNLGVRYEDGFEVSNGGLGGKQSATGGGIKIGRSFDGRRTFIFVSVDALRTDANIGAAGTSANGWNFAQPIGGPGQFVPGAAAHTGGKMEVDLLKIGVEMQVGLLPWREGLPIPQRGIYRPFLLSGLEYGWLDTKLTNRWGGIDFSIVDRLKVQNYRLTLGGGIGFDVPLTPDVTLSGGGFLRFNLDYSRGEGTYFFQQFGVGNSVSGSADGFGLTPGAGVSLGLTRRFPNGAIGSVLGEFELDSFPQLENRIGAPPTISRDYVRKYKLGVRFRF